MTEPSNQNETTELPVANPDDELPAPDEPPERISLAVRLAVLVAILVPLLAVVVAPFLVWGIRRRRAKGSEQPPSRSRSAFIDLRLSNL